LLHLDNYVSSDTTYPLSGTIGTSTTLQPGNTTFSSLTSTNATYSTESFDRIDKVVRLEDVGLNSFGEGVTFYRNSIAGTYLCNLRKITIPYGGYDYQSRLINNYYSYGNIFYDTQSKKAVFDGDCFIMPFDYVSMHKCYDSYLNNMFTFMIGYAIPEETNINLAYTSGNEFSRHTTDNGVTNLQIQPSSVNGKYI